MLLYIDDKDSDLIIKVIQFYEERTIFSEEHDRGDKIIERINEIR